MAISAKYYFSYSASATPIEEILGNNDDSGTDGSRIVHSDVDKSVGGSLEIEAGTGASNAKLITMTTTTSLVTLASYTNVDFLILKIVSAADTGIPNCELSFTVGLADQVVSKLIGVGDVCLLRPQGINLNILKVKSSSSSTLANIEILAGKEVAH